MSSSYGVLDPVSITTNPLADLLTFAGFMLILGQVLTMVSAKNMYLVSTLVFVVGSLICGVANSFPLLLLGRAIAGCGGGG